MRRSLCTVVAAVITAVSLFVPTVALASTASIEGRLHPSYPNFQRSFGDAVSIEGGTAIVGDSAAMRISAFSAPDNLWPETGTYPAAVLFSSLSLSGDDLALEGLGWQAVASRASGDWNLAFLSPEFGAADVDGDLKVIATTQGISAYRRFAGMWFEASALSWPNSASHLDLSGSTFVIPSADGAQLGIFDVLGGAMVQVGSAPLSGPLSQVSVSLSGSTLAVGTVGIPSRVEIYRRDDMGWRYETTLQPSSPTVADPSVGSTQFGAAVSVDGETVAVGAPADMANPDGKEGSVFLFERTNGVWNETLKLASESSMVPDGNGVHGSGFGRAVSLRDGRLMVGAPAENGSGAAYIYRVGGVQTSSLAINPVDPWNGWISGRSTIDILPGQTGTIRYQWDSTSLTGWQQYAGSIYPPGGLHTLYYYTEGAVAEPARSQDFKVDATAPTTPTIVSASIESTTEYAISWSASTDSESGVMFYEVWDGGHYKGYTTDTSWRFTGMDLTQIHNFVVDAVDHTFNKSVVFQRYVPAERQPNPQSKTLEHGVRLDFDDLVVSVADRADLSAAHHPAPSGFSEVDGSYFDLLVMSTYFGGVDVSVPYDSAAVSGDASRLKLYHWKTDHWEDITTRVDTVNHLVVGRTDSFSPFAVFAPTTPAPVVTSTPASSGWSIGLALVVGAGLVAHARRRQKTVA